MAEIYISTDVETDGPIPGHHSLLSIGSAAYTTELQRIATFSANLETLPGATAHPDTARWWATQPTAWAACRTALEPPNVAMHRYVQWLNTLPGRPVFVAYPAAFDFMFVYWYLMHFVGISPFSHSALDLKTLAMAILKTDYRKSTKAMMLRHGLAAPAQTHSHIALEDALEQGELLCNLLRVHRSS